jgi:hypothetical protein
VRRNINAAHAGRSLRTLRPSVSWMSLLTFRRRHYGSPAGFGKPQGERQ